MVLGKGWGGKGWGWEGVGEWDGGGVGWSGSDGGGGRSGGGEWDIQAMVLVTCSRSCITDLATATTVQPSLQPVLDHVENTNTCSWDTI